MSTANSEHDLAARIISARECVTLATEQPRVVLCPRRTAILDYTEAVTVSDLERVIRPYEEVIVHSWDSSQRIFVVPVDGVGQHDGRERLEPRERLRLTQFRSMALVGLTTAPTRRGRLAELLLGAYTSAPLGRCQWYDLVDRKRGVLFDYDTALHYIARVGHLPWIEGALRCGFRHVVDSPTRAAREAQASTELDPLGEGRVAPPPTADEWIRLMLLSRYPHLREFLIRTADSAPDGDGLARRFVVRRSDWLGGGVRGRDDVAST